MGAAASKSTSSLKRSLSISRSRKSSVVKSKAEASKAAAAGSKVALTSEQVALIQEAWQNVLPIKIDAAALLYKNLFEMDEEIKELFKGDMVLQGERLMAMVGVAVDGLNDLAALKAPLAGLGARHVRYGVKEEHYPTVGAALIATLKAAFADKWTADLERAWSAMYGVVADEMIRGATEATAATEAAAATSPTVVGTAPVTA